MTRDPDPRPLQGRARSWVLFARLWRGYLAPHRGRMLVAALVLMLEGGTLGALSWLLKPLFDNVLSPEGRALLPWVGGAILGLFLLRAGTSVLSSFLLARISRTAVMALQVDLLRHMLTLDTAFFGVHPPGSLIERVQGDTAAVQTLFTAMIMGVARDVVALAGLVLVSLTISPAWTLAALVGVPLLILPVAMAQRYVRRKSESLRAQAGDRATRLDEVFHGIRAVKLNRLEAYQTGRFATIAGRIRRAEQKMAVGRATMPALIDVVTGIGFFAVLVVAGREIAAGTRTVGDFMAFFSALALMFQPLRRLGDASGAWQVAAASLDRIFALLDTPPEARVPAAGARPPGPAPRIEFQDLRFSYPGQPVLTGLTFTAEAGQMTALVGPSGAGKSTVFDLLTGLRTPDAGRILIDGTDAAALSLPDLRAAFAVVSQDAALFDETIRENVTLGRAPDPARLAAALAAAQVTEFTDGLPGGLDTPAGPRGSALSGGQRQRVAIARALLAEAPVLLLDEATSAMDAASEALVSGALGALAAGRTTLVIAHRLATIRHADRIVVMDGGRVLDQGRHDELLARGGLYAELCHLQFRD
jgi:ATP-binding cassette subfamily B protein/subfamily B ATP-binding cassette protein MsbA